MAPSKEFWEIEEILQEGVRDGKMHYLIAWKQSWAPYAVWSLYPYRSLSSERDGEFLVDWEPSWQPQSHVSKSGQNSLRIWEEKKRQNPHLRGFKPPPVRRPPAKLKVHLPARAVSIPPVASNTDEADDSASAASEADSCEEDASPAPPVPQTQMTDADPRAEIPAFMYTHFDRHPDLIESLVEAFKLELDPEMAPCKYILKLAYENVGLEFEKTSSCNIGFQPHEGSMDIAEAVGEEFAAMYRDFEHDLVPVE